MLKRLMLFVTFLFLGFTPQNHHRVFQAQPLTRVEQEVQQWRLMPGQADAPLRYFSLTAKKLLIHDGTATHELALPPHFYEFKTSSENQFYALTQLLPALKDARYPRLVVQVYSLSGTLSFRIEQSLQDAESIPELSVLDNGGLLLSEAPIGRVTVYSPDGRLLREIELFDDAPYDLERVLMVATAQGRIAVLASKRGSAPLDSNAPEPEGQPHLFLFDLQGHLLWQQALPEAAPSNIAFSPDGEHLLVSVYAAYLFKPFVKKTLLIQSDGAVQKTFPFLFKYADFARRQKRALLADRFTVRQINLRNGALEWEHHFLPEKGMVTAVKMDEEGQKAAVLTAVQRFTSNRFEFHQPLLHIFDHQGSALQQIVFEGEKFLRPALQFRNNEIYIGFIQNLYKFGVQ